MTLPVLFMWIIMNTVNISVYVHNNCLYFLAYKQADLVHPWYNLFDKLQCRLPCNWTCVCRCIFTVVPAMPSFWRLFVKHWLPMNNMEIILIWSLITYIWIKHSSITAMINISGMTTLRKTINRVMIPAVSTLPPYQDGVINHPWNIYIRDSLAQLTSKALENRIQRYRMILPSDIHWTTEEVYILFPCMTKANRSPRNVNSSTFVFY